MRSSPAGRLTAVAARVAAVNAGKSVRYLSRALGRGGGTALPGRIATRIDPDLISGLAAGLANGTAVVTGTNGKTTTVRIMADAARAAGLPVITNAEYPNLLSGIATSLLASANPLGRIKIPADGVGVFEVDEGALPAAIRALRPRLVVITNLFPEPLDRYFEADVTAELWEPALRKLAPEATVVLNADDPTVAYVGEDLRARVVYFGMDDRQWARPGLEHGADSRRCPRCDRDLLYELSFYAHLGHYTCKECGWRRPDPQFVARNVDLHDVHGSSSQVSTPAGDRRFQLPLAGLHNACNALAAAAGASCLGLDPELVQAAADGTAGTLGRVEQVQIGDRQAILLLVKNPSGFNDALSLLLSDGRPANLLIGLNDNGPDGRDVSWIWDVDFEACQGRSAMLAASGRRAADVALRLKHAGLDDVQVTGEQMGPAFFAAIERLAAGETMHVLASYTAMSALRRELVKHGYLAPSWQMGVRSARGSVPR